VKTEEMTYDLFEPTGDLLRPINTEKNKRGFQKVSDIEKRNSSIRFMIREQDLQFINEFCDYYAMTKTEFILRSVQCYTGYNGRNSKSVLARHKKISQR
jgi:hypothetical protein